MTFTNLHWRQATHTYTHTGAHLTLMSSVAFNVVDSRSSVQCFFSLSLVFFWFSTSFGIFERIHAIEICFGSVCCLVCIVILTIVSVVCRSLRQNVFLPSQFVVLIVIKYTYLLWLCLSFSLSIRLLLSISLSVCVRSHLYKYIYVICAVWLCVSPKKFNWQKNNTFIFNNPKKDKKKLLQILISVV